MEKPTVEKIETKYKAYDRYYQQLHKDQREADNYYELTFDPGVPEDFPVCMPDTARNWVDAGVRNYTLDNPKVRFYPKKDSEAARNQVELLESFGEFWLGKEIIRIKRNAKKLLKRGEAFFKLNLDGTYLGQDNEERLFHFPLSLSTPDPINVFCSPAHNGLVPVDVIEKFEITVAEALELCERNKWNWTTKKTADKMVEWKSYYDANWRCFLIDDVPVLPGGIQPNILGFCPYVHIDGGFGDESYEGKPEYLYRPIIWSRRSMLQLEARNISQTDNIIGRYAYPRYKAILSEASSDIIKQLYPDGKIPTDPNQILEEVKDRLEITIVPGEQPPPALFTQLQMTKEYASPPTVMGGGRPPGVYSGQHQELLMSSAKPIYKDPFKNTESGLAIVGGMGLRTIEQVYKYPVEFKYFTSEDSKYYRQIRPEDIKGHYDCEVQLLADPPEATDHRKYLGANFFKSGVIDLETCLKNYFDMSEKEAKDTIARLYALQGLSSVGALDVMAKDAMSRLGMDKELELLEEAQKNAAKNIPPPKQGAEVSREETGVTQIGEMV